MAGINHTFYIIDVASGDEQYKNRSVILKNLNDLFLANITDDEIVSAKAVWVARNSVINPAPGPKDTVVFLSMLNPGVGQRTLTEIAGASLAPLTPKALGLTSLGLPKGDISEVYWDRCLNNDEVVSSLFHEASHLRSKMGDDMHTFRFPGYGGVGLRVLTQAGSTNKYPSYDDLLFYARAVKRAESLQRDRVPRTP